MISGVSVLSGEPDRLKRLKSWTTIKGTKMEQRLPAIHPGEVLLEDFMKPLDLTGYRLAKDIGVPSLRINQITRGKRSITADTALRLARYFGTSAGVWLRLQARYDLEIAETKLSDRINREVKTRTRLTPERQWAL
jgi:addiction module HigA family antidote